jgi:hypothetical protein
MVIRAIEDMTNTQQVLKVDMVPLDIQSLFQNVDGLNEMVALQMGVDFLNGVLDESVALDLLLHPFDDIIDFVLILAGRVVFSVD